MTKEKLEMMKSLLVEYRNESREKAVGGSGGDGWNETVKDVERVIRIVNTELVSNRYATPGGMAEN